MTALYLTSLVLQNSASLRFFGTFISGALPVKLTMPLIVPAPNAAAAAWGLPDGAAAALVAAAVAAVVGFAFGAPFSPALSSGQPTRR